MLGIRLVFILLVTVTGIFFIDACGQPDQPKAEKTQQDNLGQIGALPLTYKNPDDNPSTERKIELGRLLFYDPVLSGNNDVSCASCHHPEFGYAEGLELSIGVGGKGLGQKRVFITPGEMPFTRRNSQSILNTAFNGIDEHGDYDPETAPMFWDLRAKGLEEQALHPIRQLEEMRGNDWEEEGIVDEVVTRLNAIPEYRQLFADAFKEEDITAINLGKALGSFQRSLLANNSKFDQYMRGDAKALTTSEKEGMQLFIQSGCARCHKGPMLSDYELHVLGVPDNEHLAKIDTGYQGDFAFRTPSLRNLRFTAPYMHSGKIADLDHVLTFYEDLQGKPLPSKHVDKRQLDPLAKKVTLEFKNIPRILEFLNTLNDNQYDKRIPDKVPSGLMVGGNIN